MKSEILQLWRPTNLSQMKVCVPIPESSAQRAYISGLLCVVEYAESFALDAACIRDAMNKRKSSVADGSIKNALANTTEGLTDQI